MMSSPFVVSRRSAQQASTFAFVAGVVVIAFCAIALAGWIAGIEALKSVVPGLPQMKANSAIFLALVAAAICVAVRAENRPPWLVVFPAIAGSLAALTVLQSIFSFNAGAFSKPAFPHRDSGHARECGWQPRPGFARNRHMGQHHLLQRWRFVQRDSHAESLEPVQGGQALLDVVHRDRLGDLELQERR